METMDRERADRKRQAELPARLQESVLVRLNDGAPIADIAQVVVDMADVKAPLKDDEESRSEAAKRDHILDIFARTTLLSLVEQARHDGEPVMTWQGAKIQRFLDVVSAVSFPPGARPRVDPGVMLAVLEDLMDMVTVPECQQVFSNIERERDNLVKAKTNLALLRTFKKLLKRLSKTQDTVFSGRILMFMATIWSLSERSASNHLGTFNTAAEVGYSQDADMPADGSKVDKAFYQTFWSLQEHFRHPAPLATNATLSKFLDALQVVLTYFSDNAAGGTGRGPAQAEYDTTYLTSPKLLSLQLGDPNFRRHLLLQALFVLQWLRAERRNSKVAKPPPDVAAAAAERLASLEAHSKQLLRGLPPHGAQFADYVEHVLEREKNWLLWKFTPVPMTKPSKPNTPIPPGALQACPTIEKDPLTKEDALRPPGKRKAVRRTALGNEVLARVWNSTRGDPMAALRGAKRAYVPPFMDYMQRLADEMDPESGIEEEYRVAKSPVYEWRGLRLNARHNVAAFGDVARHGGDLAALLPKSMRPAAVAGKEEASQGGIENDLLQDDEDPGEGAAEESGPRDGGESEAKEEAKAEEAGADKSERASAKEDAKAEEADAMKVDRTSTAEEVTKQEDGGATDSGAVATEKAGDDTGTAGEGRAPGPQPMEVDSVAEEGGQEGPQKESAEPAAEKTEEGPAPERVQPEEEGMEGAAPKRVEAEAAQLVVAEETGQAVKTGENTPETKTSEETGRSNAAGEEAKGKESLEQSEKAGVASEALAPTESVLEVDKNVVQQETETMAEASGRSKEDDVAAAEELAGPATASTAVTRTDLAEQVSEAVFPGKASPTLEKQGPTGPKVEKTTPVASSKAEEQASTTPKVEEEVSATPQEKELAPVSQKVEEQAPGAQAEQEGAKEEATPAPPVAERGGRGRGRGRGKRKPEETVQDLAARRVTRRKK
ncbi:putative THO complex subunit THOC1 [Klebsormidium nitens]|uniref:Putative THO complex subunit THOC1 n=1 Tax=Klebsormidium nitens TaxID=105231 RepID=A0A1Y1IDZ9_KLENI|nr:putative THO complex subunit THOC1 [Klebsormidium nitens]|eukprot:GAQ89185.1 putative THO complex subunit THOC1 [Klebsormidium nitens]